MSPVSKHHKPLHSALRPNEPLDLALVTRLPFPGGVVPGWMISDFLKSLDLHGANRADQVAYSSANGAAVDALVILLRLVLALGLRPEPAEAALFDLALHNFGYSVVDDYIVKGGLLEMLYPSECRNRERVDATLGELVRHPLVVRAVWSHPALRFWRRDTWAKKPDAGRFKRYGLDEKKVLGEALPFCMNARSQPDIGEFLSAKLGIRDVDGVSIACAANMPIIIPVILKGGRKFDSIRSFALKGPRSFNKRLDGTLAPVMATRYYHLRAVLNLADGDIRLYHRNTTHVVERVHLGAHPDDDALKRARGAHAEGWTFEGSPLQYFMLVYAKYHDHKGRPYHAPCTKYGEYFPEGDYNTT